MNDEAPKTLDAHELEQVGGGYIRLGYRHWGGFYRHARWMDVAWPRYWRPVYFI